MARFRIDLAFAVTNGHDGWALYSMMVGVQTSICFQVEPWKACFTQKLTSGCLVQRWNMTQLASRYIVFGRSFKSFDTWHFKKNLVRWIHVMMSSLEFCCLCGATLQPQAIVQRIRFAVVNHMALIPCCSRWVHCTVSTVRQHNDPYVGSCIPHKYEAVL